MSVNRFCGLLLVVCLIFGVTGCGDSLPQRPEADDGTSLSSESPIHNVVFQDAVEEPAASGGMGGALQSLWGRDEPKPNIDGEDTMKWANETYEKLKARGMTTAKDAQSWVTEDFKNINAWEYKVKELGGSDGAAAESLLNKMGVDRWECFQIQPKGRGMLMFFKKRKQSYLKSLPTSDLMRLVPMMRGE